MWKEDRRLCSVVTLLPRRIEVNTYAVIDAQGVVLDTRFSAVLPTQPGSKMVRDEMEKLKIELEGFEWIWWRGIAEVEPGDRILTILNRFGMVMDVVGIQKKFRTIFTA